MTAMSFLRFSSICSWECCTLLALLRSPGLLVPYTCDCVQRPGFAPDVHACKHSPCCRTARVTCPQGLAFSPKELHSSSSVATAYISSPLFLLGYLCGQMSTASAQHQAQIPLIAMYQHMTLTGCRVCWKGGKHEYTWCKIFLPAPNRPARDGAKHASKTGA